jgi:hypothetical protein
LPQVVDRKSAKTYFTPSNPSNFEAIGVKSALSLSAGVSRWTSIPSLYDLRIIFPTFLSHMYLLCVSRKKGGSQVVDRKSVNHVSRHITTPYGNDYVLFKS